jgi:hypothetical protein
VDKGGLGKEKGAKKNIRREGQPVFYSPECAAPGRMRKRLWRMLKNFKQHGVFYVVSVPGMKPAFCLNEFDVIGYPHK